MTPFNHHLICAFWAWCEENAIRTHVRFARNAPGVVWHPQRKQPADVLSIGSNAVTNLVINEAGLSCNARIQGMAMEVFLPLESIDYVFSPDTDQIALPLPPVVRTQPAVPNVDLVKASKPEPAPAAKSRAHLTVVK